jgi:hypothetical protein
MHKNTAAKASCRKNISQLRLFQRRRDGVRFRSKYSGSFFLTQATNLRISSFSIRRSAVW